MTLQSGDILSQRYRIGIILSQSEGTALYRAFDKTSGTEVLIKELRFTGNFNPESVIEIIDRLTGLHHSNLMTMSDQFTVTGQGSYLVFAVRDIESLRQRLAETGALPYSQVIPLLLNLCDAVFYLHNLKPPHVHGDISLDTIFLSPDGKMSLLYTSDMPLESSQGRMGGDVYAIGKTAFTLLTNQPAPEGLHKEEITSRLEVNNLIIPASISAVIAQSIGAQMDQRFATSEDFKAALLYALVQIPPETLRTSPISLPLAAPVSGEGFNPISPPEALNPNIPAASPIEPSTPIRRRVPWGLL